MCNKRATFFVNSRAVYTPRDAYLLDLQNRPSRERISIFERLPYWAIAITLLTIIVAQSNPAQATTQPQGRQSVTASFSIPTHKLNELDCLTTAIAYEAGREPPEGREGVAQVILNRTRTIGYPNTICGVVFQGSHRKTGCQFTFTCDGSLRRALSDHLRERARMTAIAAIENRLPDRVYGATHYHANYVSPYWAPSLRRIGQIGAHIFYGTHRVAGGRSDWGRIPAVSPAATPETAQAPSQSVASALLTPWGLTGSQAPKR